MPEYTISLDRETCDGIFACLVRDDRFVEDEDGLAAVAAADGERDRTETAGRLTVTVADDRIADAKQAAAACPVDAISVEER